MFLERVPVRLRLSLGHAIWMALLFLGVGCGVHKYVEVSLRQSVDAALIAAANSIRDARLAGGYRSPFTQAFLREFFGEDFFPPYAQLVELSGRISASSENARGGLPVTPLAAKRAERGLMTLEDSPRNGVPPMRQVTLPVTVRGRFTGELIQVGAPLDATFHTLRNISVMLWVALTAGLILSIVFGYVLTASSLKPVSNVTKAAAILGGDDLDKRLPLPLAKDEICDLTETLNGMLDRLQDAFKRIRRFAGDVSHELRTPLTVLRGEAELALRRPRTAEEYKKSIEIIARESNHMTAIVEDLLLLARAQGNSISVSWERVAVPEFLDLIDESVGSVFAAKDIKFVVNTGDVSEFCGSPGYLGLAVKNILINAAKHSPAGSEIQFTISQTFQHTSFQIKDFGEGIPQESLPYIFDPFYRADTARNRSAGGTGIGLSLTSALVKIHYGRVIVSSEVGKGATFEIIVPRYKPEIAPDTSVLKVQRRKLFKRSRKPSSAIAAEPQLDFPAT